MSKSLYFSLIIILIPSFFIFVDPFNQHQTSFTSVAPNFNPQNTLRVIPLDLLVKGDQFTFVVKDVPNFFQNQNYTAIIHSFLLKWNNLNLDNFFIMKDLNKPNKTLFIELIKNVTDENNFKDNNLILSYSKVIFNTSLETIKEFSSEVSITSNYVLVLFVEYKNQKINELISLDIDINFNRTFNFELFSFFFILSVLILISSKLISLVMIHTKTIRFHVKSNKDIENLTFYYKKSILSNNIFYILSSLFVINLSIGFFQGKTWKNAVPNVILSPENWFPLNYLNPFNLNLLILESLFFSLIITEFLYHDLNKESILVLYSLPYPYKLDWILRYIFLVLSLFLLILLPFLLGWSLMYPLYIGINPLLNFDLLIIAVFLFILSLLPVLSLFYFSRLFSLQHSSFYLPLIIIILWNILAKGNMFSLFLLNSSSQNFFYIDWVWYIYSNISFNSLHLIGSLPLMPMSIEIIFSLFIILNVLCISIFLIVLKFRKNF